MYKSDKLYDEMKELEAQIKSINIQDVASVSEYFKLYTLLIYNYKWLGSIYDIYDANASILRGNGAKLNGATEIVTNTTQLMAAFPDLTIDIDDTFAVDDGNGGYKLYRRFYMNGTNLGYSKYGAPTGRSLEGKKSISQSMSIIEKINGEWKITYEYTMYADEWMREVCAQ